MTPDSAIELAVNNGSREEALDSKKLSSCYCYNDGTVTIFTDNAHYLVICEEKGDSQWAMLTQMIVSHQEGFYHFHDDPVPPAFVKLKDEAVIALCPEKMTPDEYYTLSVQAMRTNGLLY